jgi:hypothetical protein
MRAVPLIVLVALIGSARPEARRSRRQKSECGRRGRSPRCSPRSGLNSSERRGTRLKITSDLPPAFARRASAGEPFDVVISGSSTIDAWIKEGRLVAETRTDIARSSIGVEVRVGAAKPDISSVEALKRALLDAKSIAYLRVGSGIHVAGLVERFGIADAIEAKVRAGT